MEEALVLAVQKGGLARAQAEYVAGLLIGGGLPYAVHLEIIHDESCSSELLHDDHLAENRAMSRKLHQLLREGEMDVAVHHAFDLRGKVPEDLRLSAIVKRQSPYDVLLCPRGLGFDELDEGKRIGVVQLRARAQLMEYRPDLAYELISGDLGRWLTSMIDGKIDALVAPGAVIEQLLMQESVCEIFPPELLVPSPFSGVLLCLTRKEDDRSHQRLQCIGDNACKDEYLAEASFMNAIASSWELPIGVLAQSLGDEIAMTALVASADGGRVLRENHIASSSDPRKCGEELAAIMLSAGAEGILHDLSPSSPADAANTVDDLFEAIFPALLPEQAEWEENTDDDDFDLE